MFFTIILIIFSLILLFFGVFFMIWWKKYGKPMFFILKDLKNVQNTSNNLNNLTNMEKFYQNMNKYGGQMGDFDQKLKNITEKFNKNGKK